MRLLMISMQKDVYADMGIFFRELGNDSRQYTSQQVNYAVENIGKYGVRATARILQIPRRTLQRWCRKYHIRVKRCPDWVYEWVAKRKRRMEFWRRKRYMY